MPPCKRGLLFVLSAPSGAGKDALLKLLLSSCRGIKRCVTVTTRPPRQGEVDGVDYHFVCPEEFQRMVAAGELLEWAEVYGNLYGTPKRWVENALASGTDVILKIDVQGGLSVKRLLPEAILIFLAPPSHREQERRLRQRESENDRELQVRLAAADFEMSQMPEYDYVVVNDDLSEAAGKVACIVTAERCRVRSQRE